MPELPEVETVRRGLAELLPGRVVARTAVFDSPKAFRMRRLMSNNFYMVRA